MKCKLFNGKWLISIITILIFFFTSSNIVVGREGNNQEAECNLQLPNGFHITNYGADWATFTWQPVPGANHYRLRVFESSNGLEVYNTTEPTLTRTVNNLVIGTKYIAEVNAVCENGINSEKSSILIFPPAFIVDVITNTYEADSDYCPRNIPNGNYPFVYNKGFTFWMEIERPNELITQRLRFGVRCGGTINEADYSTWLSWSINVGHPNIANDKKEIEAPGDYAIVRNNTFEWAEVRFVPSMNGMGRVWVNDHLGNCVNCKYKIYDANQCDNPPDDGDPTDGDNNTGGGLAAPVNLENRTIESISTLPFTASPNPFQNLLKITYPLEEGGQLSMALFDLNGRLVKSQNVSTAGGEHYMITADLQPGAYMLRCRSNTESFSAKVVKF